MEAVKRFASTLPARFSASAAKGKRSEVTKEIAIVSSCIVYRQQPVRLTASVVAVVPSDR